MAWIVVLLIVCIFVFVAVGLRLMRDITEFNRAERARDEDRAREMQEHERRRAAESLAAQRSTERHKLMRRLGNALYTSSPGSAEEAKILSTINGLDPELYEIEELTSNASVEKERVRALFAGRVIEMLAAEADHIKRPPPPIT